MHRVPEVAEIADWNNFCGWASPAVGLVGGCVGGAYRTGSLAHFSSRAFALASFLIAPKPYLGHLEALTIKTIGTARYSVDCCAVPDRKNRNGADRNVSEINSIGVNNIVLTNARLIGITTCCKKRTGRNKKSNLDAVNDRF